MINLISNTCADGYYFRDIEKYMYMNPFVWGELDTKSFIRLVKDYNSLNINMISSDRYSGMISFGPGINIKYPSYYRGGNNNLIEMLNRRYMRNIMDPSFLLVQKKNMIDSDILEFINAPIKHQRYLCCMDEKWLKYSFSKCIIYKIEPEYSTGEINDMNAAEYFNLK